MRFAALAILLAALAAASLARPPRAVAADQAVESLAEQLKTGLRVSAPRDVAFCDEVARLVSVGRLPPDVVDATYVWAIRRGKKYPFPAFAAALRLKAERLGIRLP